MTRSTALLLLCTLVPACSDGSGAGSNTTTSGKQQTLAEVAAPPAAHNASGAGYFTAHPGGLVAAPLQFMNYDTDTYWNGATSYVIPVGLGGKYHFDASAFFDAGTGYALLAIRFNGITINAVSQVDNSAANGVGLSVSVDFPLYEGGYAEAVVRHTNGADLGVWLSNFSMHKID